MPRRTLANRSASHAAFYLWSRSSPSPPSSPCSQTRGIINGRFCLMTLHSSSTRSVIPFAAIFRTCPLWRKRCLQERPPWGFGQVWPQPSQVAVVQLRQSEWNTLFMHMEFRYLILSPSFRRPTRCTMPFAFSSALMSLVLGLGLSSVATYGLG